MEVCSTNVLGWNTAAFRFQCQLRIKLISCALGFCNYFFFCRVLVGTFCSRNILGNTPSHPNRSSSRKFTRPHYWLFPAEGTIKPSLILDVATNSANPPQSCPPSKKTLFMSSTQIHNPQKEEKNRNKCNRKKIHFRGAASAVLRGRSLCH